MNEWMDGCIDGCMINGWMNDKWMDGLVDGWRYTQRCISIFGVDSFWGAKNIPQIQWELRLSFSGFLLIHLLSQLILTTIVFSGEISNLISQRFQPKAIILGPSCISTLNFKVLYGDIIHIPYSSPTYRIQFSGSQYDHTDEHPKL